MKKIIIPAILVLALYSCSTKLYEPTAANVPEGMMLADLQKGKQLMADNCGKCHGMPKPSQYSKEKWAGILDQMAPKSKLNNDQKNHIYQYVISVPSK